MAYIVSNGGISTLAAAITTSSQTSISLSSGQGARFASPTGGDYTLVTIENAAGVIEIVCIVGRSTDTLTVGVAGSAAADSAGRGQEGTSAVTWASGSIIEGRATAAIVTRGGNAKTAAELIAVGGAALIGATASGSLSGATVAAQLVELDSHTGLLGRWVVAGGTADALTANFVPDVTLVDGQMSYVRAIGANTITNPTFSPDGLTLLAIVKEGGSALEVGSIRGAGHELVLRYNLANTRWELLNPVTGFHSAAAKTTPVDADEIGFWDSITGALSKVTWANIKATMLAYLATVTLATKTITETKTAPTIGGGTLTLDLTAGSVFDVALNAGITTLTISNPPASGTPIGFTLVFTADGTPRAVSWPASVKWPAAAAPSLTSINAKKDFFTFLTYDAGTTYFGFVAGQNV